MNRIILADSYKCTHFPQYPAGTMNMQSYIEARKDNSGFGIDNVTFFGLQAFIKEYLLNPFTAEDVEEAAEITAANGIPFAKKAFQRIVTDHGGYYPVEIRAVAEGSQVRVGNVLVAVESTDAQIPWIGSYLETSLLSAAWYGTSVATISRYCKELVFKFLCETSNHPLDEIPYKVLDFGMRAAHSRESAAIAGGSHLINFKGTDTISALPFLKKYYNADLADLGHSAIASEHSTTTSWGRDGEVDFYRHMLRTFGGKAPIISLVVDSYNQDNAVKNIFGSVLKDEIIKCGSLVVVRLDSGDPKTEVTKALGYLEDSFGVTVNSKGFKVLNHVRILQGDGVNPKSIQDILTAVKILGYSAENITFGMGGQLHTGVTRDTFSFAMKASSILIDGKWMDVYKDPVAGGKTSKRGRLALVEDENGELVTVRRENTMGRIDHLEVVYDKGVLVRNQSFSDVRRLAAI